MSTNSNPTPATGFVTPDSLREMGAPAREDAARREQEARSRREALDRRQQEADDAWALSHWSAVMVALVRTATSGGLSIYVTDYDGALKVGEVRFPWPEYVQLRPDEKSLVGTSPDPVGALHRLISRVSALEVGEITPHSGSDLGITVRWQGFSISWQEEVMK